MKIFTSFTKSLLFRVGFIALFALALGSFTLPSSVSAQTSSPCVLNPVDVDTYSCDAGVPAVCYFDDNPAPPGWTAPVNLDQLCEQIYIAGGVGSCPTFDWLGPNGETFYDFPQLACTPPSTPTPTVGVGTPTPVPPTPTPGGDPGTCGCDSTIYGACFVPPGGNNCNVGYDPVCAESAQACTNSETSCTCQDLSTPPDNSCTCIEFPEDSGDYFPGVSSCNSSSVPMCNTSGTCICTEPTDCGNEGEPCCGFSCTGSLQCIGGGGFSTCQNACENETDCGVGQGCIQNQCVQLNLWTPLVECPDGTMGINSGIGCIPVENLNKFSGSTLSWGLGIGGGIAFLLMVMASFMIKTSAGDPKRLQAGRELMFAAIAGLILIVFSVFVLRVIGVNVFGIPEL